MLRSSERPRGARPAGSEALLAQAMQSAACNACHAIGARLSCWLLRARDLAGRRPAAHPGVPCADARCPAQQVSGVANTLQQAGLISYRRGHIRILNMAALQESSCECYAAAKFNTVSEFASCERRHEDWILRLSNVRFNSPEKALSRMSKISRRPSSPRLQHRRIAGTGASKAAARNDQSCAREAKQEIMTPHLAPAGLGLAGAWTYGRDQSQRRVADRQTASAGRRLRASSGNARANRGTARPTRRQLPRPRPDALR